MRNVELKGARQAAPHTEPQQSRTRFRDRPLARRVATSLAALALTVPGYLATAANTGDAGNNVNQQPSPSGGGISLFAQGEIHPANHPSLCLSAEPQPNGMPPKVGSEIEVVPCGRENPYEIWNIHQEVVEGEHTLIFRLGKTDLALSAETPPNLNAPAVHARLGYFESGNNPFVQLPGDPTGPFWVINEGGRSSRVLTVPKNPTGHAPYDHALWMDEEMAMQSGTEETIFKLPQFTTVGVA